ncbi:hypothetical protein ACJX0J_031024, partial [Zea mays]
MVQNLIKNGLFLNFDEVFFLHCHVILFMFWVHLIDCVILHIVRPIICLGNMFLVLPVFDLLWHVGHYTSCVEGVSEGRFIFWLIVRGRRYKIRNQGPCGKKWEDVWGSYLIMYDLACFDMCLTSQDSERYHDHFWWTTNIRERINNYV